MNFDKIKEISGVRKFENGFAFDFSEYGAIYEKECDAIIASISRMIREEFDRRAAFYCYSEEYATRDNDRERFCAD